MDFKKAKDELEYCITDVNIVVRGALLSKENWAGAFSSHLLVQESFLPPLFLSFLLSSVDDLAL